MSGRLVKTKDPGLLRDTESGALLTADMRSFESYKAMREQLLESKKREQKTEALEDKVERLEALVESLLRERDG